MSFHNPGPVCDGCETFLQEAHPRIARWFRELKKEELMAHISCAWRNAAEQNKAKREGKSGLSWPNSRHNRLNPKTKKPESAALDIFVLDEDGIAQWPPRWFFKINQRNEAFREPLIWGGKFSKLGDANHFELKPSELIAA